MARLAGAESIPLLVTHEARFPAKRRQPQIRVVDAQHQAMLGSGREHSVGFEASLGHQVVDHDADVRLIAAQDQRRQAFSASSGVGAGDQPLARRLLVSRCSVDLAGQEQPGNAVSFERGRELGRLDEVVLDGITGSEQRGRLEPRQHPDGALLDLDRKAHRVAVEIDLADVDTLRLQEQLVPFPVGESHHLVFQRRAVSRADSSDLPIEKGRLRNVLPHELMHFRRCVQEPAGNPVRWESRGRERKRDRLLVAVFHVEHTSLPGPPRNQSRRGPAWAASRSSAGPNGTRMTSVIRPAPATAARRRGPPAADRGQHESVRSGTCQS